MRSRRFARAVLSFAGFLIAWWSAVRLFEVPAFLLPAPDAVAARIVFLARSAGLADHAMRTLAEIACGFALGGFAGICAGALFARWPRLERLAWPLVLAVQTAPKIALAPLLLLWLGLGAGPKIVLVAIVTFFPALSGALAGFGHIDRAYRELGRILGLGPLSQALRIDLALAMPAIAAGLRIASTQAVTAAVIGELMGANRGLGYLLASGQENGDAAAVIGVILLLALTGWLFHETMRAAERRLLSWHPSARAEIG